MADGVAPNELVVLLAGQLAGTLTRGRSPDALAFAYDDRWRSDPAAFPLSLSLPLASRTHEGQSVAYYLRALLPDNEARLNAIAFHFGVAPDDSFALLAHIGEDCPGAVQFARPDRVSALESDGPGEVRWLTERDLAAMLRELRSGDPASPAIVTGQFSLPGNLDKTALTWNPRTKQWGRPSGRTPTTHIIKPPIRGLRQHNENEHLCLELARAVGCVAAHSAILRAGDQQAIAVERYDRERRGRVIRRLHQEDITQALGVNPRLKYAGEGAPGIADVVTLLREYSSNGIDDVYRFLRAVALNWVIAGTDAHPRNYSVLIGPRGLVTLAPLYELASALVPPTEIPTPELPFPMRIGGRRILGDIDRAAWEAQATVLRLNPARVVEEVITVAEHIRDAAPAITAAAAEAEIDTAFAKRFASRVTARAAACIQTF